MKQLIDKSVVAAEIEKRKNQFVSQAESFRKIGKKEQESYFAALASNMNSLSCFIDTIEIKEVDLERESAWKPADSDDLPEIDREVIVLLSNNKVCFAHRPQEYWDGKNIATEEITRYYPKRYDKDGWNQPNVKWWLDLDLPKIE